jgi:hypothetical protein
MPSSNRLLALIAAIAAPILLTASPTLAASTLDGIALAKIEHLTYYPPYSQHQGLPKIEELDRASSSTAATPAPSQQEMPDITLASLGTPNAGSAPSRLNDDPTTTTRTGLSPTAQRLFDSAPSSQSLSRTRIASNTERWWDALDNGVPIPDGITSDEVWVHISVGGKSLTLMKGRERLKRIDYVAFGAAGAQPIRRQGSRLTPMGEFRIDHINPQSQYHHFYRFDYPNPAVAEQALAEGVINQATHDYIKRYYARHGRAPMDTPLGGYLGLHGLGNKDPFLHSRTQWTDGCTAVTNEEIDTLKPWLALGTRVVIQ